MNQRQKKLEMHPFHENRPQGHLHHFMTKKVKSKIFHLWSNLIVLLLSCWHARVLFFFPLRFDKYSPDMCKSSPFPIYEIHN